jgi:Tol biopolymer transport system component
VKVKKMNKTIAVLSLICFLMLVVKAQQPQSMFIQDVSWSSDGKYLAFTGMHDFDQKNHTFKADIYVVRADGSALQKISSDDKNEFYTSWAKGRVAFGADVPGTKNSDIYSANPDGSDLRQLTKDSSRNATPSFSRDGKRIAFVSTRDGEKHQIYVMNSDGSNLLRLTKDPAVSFYNPQLSPDGKHIVYYAEKGDNLDQIWVMNIDGSDQRLLTGGIGHNIFPGWSADGKRIIFSSSKRDKNDSGSFVEGSYIYTMNADGSALTKLGNINSFFARYSPDGKKIAYISGRFPNAAIYVANADGSGAVKVSK